MAGNKTLRLTVATLFAGASLGAGTVAHGANSPMRPAASNVISITDWQFPAGCNTLSANQEASVEGCAAETYDSLVGINNKLDDFADLATVIPTAKNGGVKVVGGNQIVTWTLKPNLKWSDGQPLTVDDAMFGVPLNIALGNNTGLDQIKSMKKVSDRVFQVTYKGVYAPYVDYGPLNVYPRHYLEKKYGTTNAAAIAKKFGLDAYNSPNDVFSGPYKIGSWTNGQNVTLVQNPYYNALPAASGHPRPSQIKFVTIANDEAALAQALQSPKAGVDAAEDFQTSDIPTLNGAKSYTIHSVPGLLIEHLELNQAGVLKDARLRQALQYAVNKPELVHQLFPALSDPNSIVERNVLPIPNRFYDKSQPISEYNPAKAKALLKAAGYATDYNGPGKHLSLRLVATQTSARVKSFGILARYWATVGIHVSPGFGASSGNNGIYESWANNGVLQHGRFDIALMAYQESPDPQQSEPNYNPANIPGPSNTSGQNESHITDADQYALLQSAGHQLDAAQRLSTFHKWQQLVNSRVYWIPLYNRPQISADNGTIGNYQPHPGQQSNEWNSFQWYKK
jgi:peptide/nickel transport system substrate-binding protein